uniref:Uncharacterized protein n=1 Tax=Arundo donax TaxID=35708 RepID=A0A0A8YBJ1_ARUDO
MACFNPFQPPGYCCYNCLFLLPGFRLQASNFFLLIFLKESYLFSLFGSF